MVQQASIPTIVFVSALQEETDPLWSDPRFRWSEPQEAGDSIWFRSCVYPYCGREYRLVSAAACEMGLTATTILTAKLVLRWQPLLVIGFGICAGIKGRLLSLGDVIISTKALLYQFGRNIDGQLLREKREEKLCQEMEPIVHQFGASWPATDVAKKFNRTGAVAPKARMGAYASADFVSRDELKMAEAASLDTQVLAVDMETYAILRTARRIGAPYGGVSVKAVSDHGDKNKAKTGRGFVKFMSKEAAIGLAHQFMESCKLAPSAYRDTYEGSVPVRSDNRAAVLTICPATRTYESLRDQLTNPITTPPEDAAHPEICSGKLGDITLHLARFPKGDAGHVDGALWATCLIAKCKPHFVLLAGPCGGFSQKGCRLGDLIIPNRAFHFQYGAFHHGSWLPEVRAVDIHDRIRGFLFAHAKDLLETAAAEQFRTYAGEPTPDGGQPGWHIEPIASSDLYLRDTGKVNEAVKRDRKVIAVEMEGYAVMRAAVHAGVPLGCLIVRSVADFADKEGARYADLANHMCTGVVMSLLLRGLGQLVSRS